MEMKRMHIVCTFLFFIAVCVFPNNSQDLIFPTEYEFECRKSDGQIGVCRIINDCSDDYEGIKRAGITDVCGFSDRAPWVCCSIEESKPIQHISNSDEPAALKFERICNDTFGEFKEAVFEIAAVGGKDTRAKEYPHMAALGYDTPAGIKYFCGGSLITRKIVLTAAHCLFSREFGDVKYVRLGDLNLAASDDDAEPQDFTIIRRVKHPDYNSKFTYHDIAIVELDKEVRLTDYVKPACVHTQRQTIDFGWIATGWGNLGFDKPQADHLQEISIREYPNSECSTYYKIDKKYPQGIVDDWQICAGEEYIDTCQGDSGGPLQYTNVNAGSFAKGHIIIGVTSFGKACGISKSPGIYTRVFNYIDWIASVSF